MLRRLPRGTSAADRAGVLEPLAIGLVTGGLLDVHVGFGADMLKIPFTGDVDDAAEVLVLALGGAARANT